MLANVFYMQLLYIIKCIVWKQKKLVKHVWQLLFTCICFTTWAWLLVGHFLLPLPHWMVRQYYIDLFLYSFCYVILPRLMSKSFLISKNIFSFFFRYYLRTFSMFPSCCYFFFLFWCKYLPTSNKNTLFKLNFLINW